MSKTLSEYRPSRLDGFVGFDGEKRKLRRNIDALSTAISMAVEGDRVAGWYPGREDPPRLMVSTPHILVYGAPGSGKTTLAELYAREIITRAKQEQWPQMLLPGVACLDEWTAAGRPPSNEHEHYYYVRLDGSQVKSYEELDHYIYFLQAYGVILIDEIHNLKPALQEKLYKVMMDGVWQSPYANGQDKRRMGFTIIGTTTDQSKLKPAFRRRFETQIELFDYSQSDLDLIADNAARTAGLTLTPEARAEVVNRGKGSPNDIVRVVNSLLRLRLASRDMGGTPIGVATVIEAAEDINFGPGGLEPAHARILSYLRDNDDGAISGKTLCDGCGIGTIDNLEEWEVLLKYKGYVTIGTGGRRITGEGKKILKDYDSVR